MLKSYPGRFVLIVLLVVAIKFSWVYFVNYWNPDQALFHDSYDYLGNARSLLYLHQYTASPETSEPTFFRPPGYPFFLAAIFAVFGENLTAVFVVQVLLSLLTVLITFHLARKLWNIRVAILASILIAFEPLQLLAAGRILTESLHTLIFTLIALVGVRSFQEDTPSFSNWVLLGILTAISTYVRPVTYYLPVLIIMLILFNSYLKKTTWRNVVRKIVFYCLPVILTIGAWQVRNYFAVGSSRFSGVESKHLLYYRGGAIHLDSDRISHKQLRANFQTKFGVRKGEREGPYYERMQREGLQLVLKNPGKNLMMMGKGLIGQLFGMNRYVNVTDKGIALFGRICLTIFYLIMLTGILSSFLSGSKIINIFLSSICVYILLCSSSLGANSRFRIPIMPIFCLYAAAGIETIRQKTKKAGVKENEKKVVFIMGSGHSGSTLLDLTLGSHSCGFSLGEFSTLSGKMKNGRLPPAICEICGEKCKFWNQRASIPLLESYFRRSGGMWLRQKIYDRFGSARHNIYQQLFEWSGAEILIDSSKSISWIRRQLRPFWHWKNQDSFLIFICRDGRAIVNSYLRKYPDKDIKEVTEGWMKITEKMEHFFQSFPPDRRIRISYESLATQPEKTVSSLCNFLGIPYEPHMLQYWKQDHHVVHGNSRTRGLIVKYQEFMESVPAESVSRANNGPEFDQSLGLGIQLDLKWKRELSGKNLEIFERIAGNLNRDYAYDEK